MTFVRESSNPAIDVVSAALITAWRHRQFYLQNRANGVGRDMLSWAREEMVDALTCARDLVQATLDDLANPATSVAVRLDPPLVAEASVDWNEN